MQKRNYRHKRKAYNSVAITQIINKRYHAGMGERSLIEAVQKRYSEIAMETVLAGFEFTIPLMGVSADFNGRSKYGELKLCVKRTMVRDSGVFNIRAREKKYNLRRINERNAISWECERLTKKKHKFVPSKEFKDGLKNILENTYQEFRLA